MADKVLSVNHLIINFKTDNGIVHAVRDVSFDLERGETLCIVGESGSGKSVTSKAIMGILANNAMVDNGSILYQGENLLEVSEEEFYKIRGHKIGMIFQDPLSSLNPIVRIGKQITEATLINSNKLKMMYNDLISNDLIAYKNVFAKKNIKIAALNKELSDFIDEVNQKKAIEKNTKSMNDLKNQLDFKIQNVKIKCPEKENAQKEIIALNEEFQKQKTELEKELAKLNEAKAKGQHLIKPKEQEIKKLIAKTKIEAKEKASPLKEKLERTKKMAKEKVAQKKNEILNNGKEKIASLKNKLQTCISNEEKEKVKAEIKQVKLDTLNSLKITKAEAKKRALEIMKEVGIPEPERRFKQYPFEFSGGMRQRIVIAIALTANPEILICDEPTTALDVTIQAQILELINRIKKERDLSCIFITHDLGVVANMADRVAVMYAGKIVEYGTSEEIFFEPKHPYTWALLSSIPDVNSKERLEAIPGTPPNMIYPPKGDAFALRSKYAMKIDFEAEPPFFKVSDTHYAATWLLDERAPKVEMPKIVSERIKNALKGGEMYDGK